MLERIDYNSKKQNINGFKRKSLKNNMVYLIISVRLIQVMNSLETTEEALQSIDSIVEKFGEMVKNSCADVNEHTHLDNSEKNMSPELLFYFT
ncbi:hypothetical protein BpHYR1_023486 [Brachionus plicatilis]|uniref:Uncharacterized protein n=1 Tax=Brachionus plicatilis TaxID=10195 RepID=A0A3M7RMW8_BRAPC|nr:hypothetical protein BpHYR1_023486 [Brachionus plicatilis]